MNTQRKDKWIKEDFNGVIKKERKQSTTENFNIAQQTMTKFIKDKDT